MVKRTQRKRRHARRKTRRGGAVNPLIWTLQICPTMDKEKRRSNDACVKSGFLYRNARALGGTDSELLASIEYVQTFLDKFDDKVKAIPPLLLENQMVQVTLEGGRIEWQDYANLLYDASQTHNGPADAGKLQRWWVVGDNKTKIQEAKASLKGFLQSLPQTLKGVEESMKEDESAVVEQESPRNIAAMPQYDPKEGTVTAPASEAPATPEVSAAAAPKRGFFSRMFGKGGKRSRSKHRKSNKSRKHRSRKHRSRKHRSRKHRSRRH